MLLHRNIRLRAATFALLFAVASPITLGATAGLAEAAEAVLSAEKNPPGDIPDSQVFIDYAGPSGIHVKVPEGWARRDLADGASFTDKYDGVAITVSDSQSKPTVASVRSNEVQNLKAHGHAVRIGQIKFVKLPAGEAVRIVFTSNSEPNQVTGKQARLENERFLFFKDGKLARLDVFAPKGADNVDQWRLMSRSFRWQ